MTSICSRPTCLPGSISHYYINGRSFCRCNSGRLVTNLRGRVIPWGCWRRCFTQSKSCFFAPQTQTNADKAGHIAKAVTNPLFQMTPKILLPGGGGTRRGMSSELLKLSTKWSCRRQHEFHFAFGSASPI